MQYDDYLVGMLRWGLVGTDSYLTALSGNEKL